MSEHQNRQQPPQMQQNLPHGPPKPQQQPPKHPHQDLVAQLVGHMRRGGHFREEVGVKKVKMPTPEFCTFSQTGEVGIKQKLYNCVTCKMEDGHCICEICIKNCHQGHTVLFSEDDLEGYCDCGEQGSKGKRSCNMLKGRICSFSLKKFKLRFISASAKKLKHIEKL